VANLCGITAGHKHVQCRVPVKIHEGQKTSDTKSVIAEMEARPVNEGANLDVIETHTHGEILLRTRIDGLWLASPIQVLS